MQTMSSSTRTLRTDGIQTIEPELLFQWLASGRRVLVLDVRDAGDVGDPFGRLPGARHVPLRQLFARRDELARGKDDPVVTVSNTGIRSQEGAFTLSLLGFADVRSLEGGLEAWARAKLPLE